MADKEASVRLTLKGDGFKRGMSEVEADAKKKAKAIGDGFKSALSEGGKAGLDSLKNSFSKIKDIATGFLGIAGGIGIAELARKAMQNEGAFRKMAFAIKAGTGELVNWRDLQKEAQATALKTGHTTEEVAASMKTMRDVTGDTSFARKASAVVAEVATGSHESLESISALAGGLNEKFGVTHEQLGDTLASVISLGDAGGVTVEELSENINRMGAGAKQAGLSGQQGFQTMVEWLHVAHGATGNLRKGISGVSGIIDGLSSGSLRIPVLQHAQYDIEAAKKSGKDFNTIIGDIIAKTGGKQERLAQIFSGDQLKVVTEVGKTYTQAFAATSGDVKAKTAAGLAAYNQALKEQSKSSLSYAQIQEEAAKELETPEMKIKVALEKLAQVFTSPKMMSAFEKLAEMMPKIVDAIVEHPLLTGAIATGIPQAIASAVMAGLAKGLFSGGGGGAGGPAGAAGPIAAAAGLAYLVGREAIDEHIEKKSREENQQIFGGNEDRNLLSASRTMKGPARDQELQTAQQRVTALEKQRADSAEYSDLQRMSNSATGFSGYNAGPNALGAGQGAEVARQRMAQLEDMGAGSDVNLAQELADAKQAVANLRDKGYGTQGGALAHLAGPEMYGRELLGDQGAFGAHQKRNKLRFSGGLGGIGQDDRDAANAAKTAATAPIDSAAAQGRALADAIAGRKLMVHVVNAAEIRPGGAAGPAPTPGLIPR